MRANLILPSQSNRRVFISALIVGAGFLVSKITGIFDDLILARTIGAGSELDAYYAAFGLPDLLFTLIAGGALASAFIPVFSGLLEPYDRSRAWQTPTQLSIRLSSRRRSSGHSGDLRAVDCPATVGCGFAPP